MTKRTKQIRSCRSKKSYQNWAHAKGRCRRIWDDVKLRPYKCQVCGMWHLTHIRPEVRLQLAFQEAGL